ncbi:MAG: putative entry exclusion protein TrbK-alt [Bradyrhizobium sp.]|jgi:conjugative transfer region protein TrbK|uniref:putative entry exclusion protein TrbK-alt n=3 Tax=Nitrobacteraceae TaxID=41294 RepID=UPI0004199E06|nr:MULTISPECIES: putative entry exclusion protein TrbK-alt [Bradyrhizobium]MDU0953925.1 putative entry exclusion protein TrbK-alt [Bradyrhizobium sp.]MDU1497283.1 putative entry exclusion protein TrbK-alt [Bradyrhizobium sp.]MDU1546628.1 putative entry exclusion protein TrbK-alt [Bradyrhizobium sp.]MDU1689208.1 putative entry exclusion protein TrbK-alt [Bradyrhizobium sp.]MDU1803982.1 putative entry exclusion protein TrbK-alt [Bradyrhizobium sp.]
MDGKTLARVGAIVFVAVAITATAIEMNRKDVSTDVLATRGRPVTALDPLTAELLRCSEIGEAGTRDPGCLKAWAENRRRFLGRPAPVSSPSPVAPATLFPSAPASAAPIHKDSAPADVTGPAMQAEPAQPEVR